MKTTLIAAGAALSMFTAASPAMAARMFTLTATGTDFDITATLTTTNNPNQTGYNNTTGYLVTGITGTVTKVGNGNIQTINGLSPVGSYPTQSTANDNILETAAPYFDIAGLSFTTAQGGSPFNLYYSSGYLYIRGADETNTGSFTSVKVTAVPEPAAWGMMILGMSAVGYALRRRTAVKARIRFA